jgi:hypothetical protein
MKHYLVVYDKTHVVSIDEFADANAAGEKADAVLDASDGRSAQVISASSREDLGIKVGDPADAEDSEFGFRGFE